MHNLLLLSESFTNGYRPEALNFLFLISVFSAIFVIISKNPIISVLFLIGLFLSIACYLLVLGLNFIGLSYLLVYVGAVSILFLFILMLINVRISELLNNASNTIPLALVIAVYFNYLISEILPSSMSFNLIIGFAPRSGVNDYSSLFKIDKNYSFLSDNANIAFVTSKI